MARKHLWFFPAWGSVELLFGDPWAHTAGMAEGFSLVVVDGGMVPALGRLPAMPSRAWVELGRLAGGRGNVVLGEIGRRGAPGETPLAAFMDRASESFSRVVYYEGGNEGFFLMSGPEAVPWSPALPGFRVTASKEG